MPKQVQEKYFCDHCGKEHTPFRDKTYVFTPAHNTTITVGEMNYYPSENLQNGEASLYFCSRACILAWFEGFLDRPHLLPFCTNPNLFLKGLSQNGEEEE